MVELTPAVIITVTTIAVAAIDKIIEILVPNSKINNIFDVVIKFLNGIAAQFVPTKKS